MPVKHSVYFDLERRKNLTSDIPIRMRIAYKGYRIDIPLGYRIDPANWNNEQQTVVKGAVNAFGQTSQEINKRIGDFLNYVNEIFTRFEIIEKSVPTPDQFKKLFNELSGRAKIESKNPVSLFDVFDEFILSMGEKNQWSNSTFKKFRTIKNQLQKVNPKLTLESITENDLQNFIKYSNKIDHRNSTIAKSISFIRWFLRWAFNSGKYTGNLHQTFRPKLRGTDGNHKEIIHLTWDELIHLLNFQFPSDKVYLERTKDVFCFTCFTGLRHSDVYKLKRADVKDNYILIVTQKTNESLKIELNKYSRSILEKYSSVTIPDQKVLPVISNQKMNDYLKEMGKLAGINEPTKIVYFKGSERLEETHPKYSLLSSHCGRRTFIVNALYLGIPAEVVMKWTGHSGYAAMKPYIKIVDKLKELSMNKFNEK